MEQDDKVSAPVAKTAQDALNAKTSAIGAGYDGVKSCHNGNLYRSLLEKMRLSLTEEMKTKSYTKHGGVKRQSPLVNAGYALRISSLSRMIYEFIQCQSDRSVSNQLNVVFIGCGFDVLGLWAASYDNVNIYEFDCYKNCVVKKRALINSGMIIPIPSGNEETFSDENRCILHGLVQQHCSKMSMSETNGNYSLINTDLTCKSSVQDAFTNSSLDHNLPTIVISELVLAYLGNENVKHLLSYLASNVCQNEHSILVAYEPVFPSPTTGDIIQGYAIDYFNLFSEKLNRGNAENNEKNKSSTLFEPLGRSPQDVIDLMRSCGFDGGVDCQSIARASKYLRLGDNVSFSPELFDEHAAFVLHMHCYSVIGAQVTCSNKTSIKDFLSVCPWSNTNDASMGMGRLFKMNCPAHSSDKLTICAIQKQHQEQVRVLFSSTYSKLSSSYPSVKKMVKTAMKADLNIISKAEDTETSDQCAIWKHYSSNGGSFWVVIDENRDDRIEGCIGIRQLPMTKDAITSTRSYEIQRFAVHSDSRGKGVGKLLLQTAENFIQCKHYDDGVSTIYAATPDILEAANSFYSSNSFEKIDDTLMGTMNIRKYRKTLVCND